MSYYMDIKAPYKALGPNPKQADYCVQGGQIYGWSESNISYELCWWLTPQGEPINNSEHVRNLLKDRPFDKEWLNGD